MRKPKTGEANLPIRAGLRWRPAGGRRVAAALVVALVVALAGVVVANNPGDSPAQTPPVPPGLQPGVAGVVVANNPGDSPAQAPPVPPGLQPGVQKWLNGRGQLQIELNNALVPFVQNKLGNATCQRLTRAAHRMSALGRASHARVDELARTGLAKFEQGAAACLAGNLAEGERLVREGLAERTAATEPLDETLDGE